MRKIDEKFLDLKEKAELMMDLSYSALLYDSRVIAKEVYTLENEIDAEHVELQRMAIEGARDDGDVDKALFYVKLASALELIADSAREISDIALRDMDMHPIFQQSIKDSEEIISSAVISPGSPAAGKSLKELDLPTKSGMWVVAIKRGNRWIYGPDGSDSVMPGDVVIAKGPGESEEELVKLLGKKVEWDSSE